MVNKRKNHQKRQKLRSEAQKQANAIAAQFEQQPKVVNGEKQYKFYRPPPKIKSNPGREGTSPILKKSAPLVTFNRFSPPVKQFQAVPGEK